MKKKRSWQPVLLLLYLAPFCGEVLSTSSPPLEIIQPITRWKVIKNKIVTPENGDV